jgi:acetyl-CoA carboxylase biotin carboxyl carrier protein
MDDKTLLALFDKFEKSSIAEMKYSRDGCSFELRRKEAFAGPSGTGAGFGAHQGAPFLAVSPAASPVPVSSEATPAPHSAVGPESPVKGSGNEYILSPIVGTFYRAPSPDAPAYADVGKRISKGQKICIIEAMKMMNALEAELDCEIVKILVNNGDMVEFEQPLFEVRPA